MSKVTEVMDQTFIDGGNGKRLRIFFEKNLMVFKCTMHPCAEVMALVQMHAL
jgi:hypothetical protein